MPKLAALLFLLPLLPHLSACAAESHASSPTPAATATQAATPGAGPRVPVFTPPPPATANAGGAPVSMGIGTYCWVNACVDAVGPVTGTTELVVQRGATVEVRTAFAGSDIRDAVPLASDIGTAQGKPLSSGDLFWSFSPVDGSQLHATITGTGVSFDAPSTPGRYVVNLTLYLQPDKGDVAYGVVLDVR
jgi:hypothetical protein